MPTTYVNFICNGKEDAEKIKGSLFSYYANPTVLFKNFMSDGQAFQFILEVPETTDESWKDALEDIINEYKIRYGCLAQIIYQEKESAGEVDNA